MNKLGTKLGAIAMSAIMAVSFAPSAVITTLAAGTDSTDATTGGVPVYGCYNPNSGEHYFTVNAQEVTGLLTLGWQEGDVKWYAPEDGDEVYCLYNPNVFAPDGTPLGDHHYTADKTERDNLLKAGWKQGDLAFYSATKDDLDRDAVYCAYNPNAYALGMSGAHQLTVDPDEYAGLVLLGWSGEGEKFYGYAEAPIHEDFTVTIDNTTPKVGDTLTAIPEGAAAATYQWLADGVAINGATEATLKVTSDLAGKRISVTVTDAEGNEATSDPTKPVSNVSAEITIADVSGLQEDGTGLVGDTLALSYGSELGVPKTITWYYNQKVVKAWDSNGGQLDAALALKTGKGTGKDYNGLLKDGEYYAVIINSTGGVFTSNTIELTYVEQAAIVSDFAIADELSKPNYVDVDDEDSLAVMSVTLNKDYTGTFYIFDEDIQSYKDGREVAKLTVTQGDDSNQVNILSDLTTEKCMEKGGLIKYVDSATGETTYMFTANKANWGSLTRGSNYKLAFSQPDVESTKIDSVTARKDIETTDTETAPYLPAPAKLEVKTAFTGAPAVVDIEDADGNAITWLGPKGYSYDAGDCGFSSFIVYGNTAMTATDAKKLDQASGTIEEGEYTGTDALAGGYKFFYAEAKTTAGIYGKDSVTITSGFKTENAAIATEAKISEDGADAAKANVALKTVTGNATAYIYNASDYTFDPDDKSTYLGKASIKAGDASVSFDNVFKKANKGDNFQVIIIPEDEATFTKFTGKEFELKAVPTSLKFEHGTATVGVTAATVKPSTGDPAAGTITITDTGLIAYDQFGDQMVTAAGPSDVTSVTVTNKDNTSVESGTAQYTVAATTGQVTITLTELATGEYAIDKGDGFTITVLGSKVTVMASNDAVEEQATTDQGLVVKVGDDELKTGVYAKSIGAATVVKTTDTATMAYGNPAITLANANDLIDQDGNAFTPVATWKDTVKVYSDEALETETGAVVAFAVTGGASNVTAVVDSGINNLAVGTNYYFKYLGCTYTLTVNAGALAIGNISATIVQGATTTQKAALTATENSVDIKNGAATYTFSSSTATFTAAMTTADAAGKCTFANNVLTIPADVTDGQNVVITFTGTGNYAGTATVTITLVKSA